MFKRTILTAACVAVLGSTALAVDTPSRSDMEAFLNAPGSGSRTCVDMLSNAKTAMRLETDETSWKLTAATSKICLEVVRNSGASTQGQKLPRFMLIRSCYWISNNADYSIIACQGVPLS